MNDAVAAKIDLTRFSLEELQELIPTIQRRSIAAGKSRSVEGAGEVGSGEVRYRYVLQSFRKVLCSTM